MLTALLYMCVLHAISLQDTVQGRVLEIQDQPALIGAEYTQRKPTYAALLMFQSAGKGHFIACYDVYAPDSPLEKHWVLPQDGNPFDLV